MYKIRIPCTELELMTHKINHELCKHMLPLLRVQTYSYIDSIHFVQKYTPGKNPFTQKYIEVICNSVIKKQQLRRFTLKLHKLGITNKNENTVNVDFIDTSQNQIVHSLNYHTMDYSNPEKRNSAKRHKNRSTYSSYIMYSKL